LFIYASSHWEYDFIQVQPEPGGEWVTVPDAPYLKMAPFGYRTRFDEYARKGMVQEASLEQFAVWVRKRHADLLPERRPLAGMRLVTVTDQPTLNVPIGHWRKPPLSSFPPEARWIGYAKIFEVPGSGGVDAKRQGR
jgi:hypothetical protein